MYDSNRIEASFSGLLDQATQTADGYMRQAKRDIDATFGDGYAAKHPELVAAYMQTACRDFTAAATAKVLGSALDNVADSIRALERE